MRLTLSGNPNCGKTTLYNTLTGELESVGNWSGVTVEPAEVPMRTDYGIATIVDLPGVYSLTAYSSEEGITLDYINPEKSDVLVNIVDITNLSRSLYFTTQLLELRIPMIIALNKVDILQDEIDTRKLALALGCPVIAISAERGDCLEAMVTLAATASRPAKREPLESDQARYEYIEEILAEVYVKKVDRNQTTTADKVDWLLTSKLFGLPIFFAILGTLFFIAQEVVGSLCSYVIGDLLFGQIIPDFLNNIFDAIHLNPLLQDLIVDAMVRGVGAVLSYVPLIMTLFFLLALLEDCGYMARVAVVMDVFFKKIGLSGKAIIPMVVGTGCSVPGVMASRTVENENERKRLCILTPFVPCGRKLPVIILFSSLFYEEAPWIYPAIYCLTFLVIFGVGLILKALFTVNHEDSIFIIELPQYRLPRLSFACQHMVDKAWVFIKRATSIILVSNTVIWLLQTYDFTLHQASATNESMLAALGNALVPLFIPLGFGVWQLVVATLTGFIAKENVVSTLYIIYFANMVQGEEMMQQSVDNPLLAQLGLWTGLSYLLFQLFTLPCFSTIAAMWTEMKDKTWFFLGMMLQFTTGYTISFLCCQMGTFLTTGAMATGFLSGFALILVMIAFLYHGSKEIRNDILDISVRC